MTTEVTFKKHGCQMEWSEVDESMRNFPFCNITQAYKYLMETTIEIGTKSVDYLYNMTGCQPNCVTYKYEAVKIAPRAVLGNFAGAKDLPGLGYR